MRVDPWITRSAWLVWGETGNPLFQGLDPPMPVLLSREFPNYELDAIITDVPGLIYVKKEKQKRLLT